ncbi:metallophosphoesterase family protein [Taibaiella helva]|uniref:metallophosphoesterase family protein n=1 Tax=Taibaiella helva TaxID=2301235 RepID=UPI000E588229|nr:metallophosphoesterase [Taibaiella helva]
MPDTIVLQPRFSVLYTALKRILLVVWLLQGLPALAFKDTDQNGNDTMIFVSDTQAPLFVERLIHRTPFNRTATGLIFDDILGKRPQQVFLLGDVVAAGSKPARWTRVDRFLDSIRKDKGAVWACLGNHEYLYSAKAGVSAFQKRFPGHSKTGYYIIRDSVAVVLLNSNLSRLTTEEQRRQEAFYQEALSTLDRNDSVRVIIVACHHAPYSNSKVVGSNLKVREQFAVPFLQTKKGLLFLSGHSHNFEHFRIGGKTFLVIGGGGGIRQHLNTGADRIECENDGCHPAFHYLMVKRQVAALQITCRALKDDLSAFENVLSLTINGAHAASR